MEKLDYVIDIQAFHDKDGAFLPKEIAVIGADCNFISHWLIKPPYSCSEIPRGLLATNSYLTCFHHGIEWFDGESNLEDVYDALREVARNAMRIYTRGAQKVLLLEKVLSRQIINLEDYRCPSFKNLPRINEHFCFYHGRKREYFSCALAYAYKLRMWLLKTLYTPDASVDEPDGKLDKKVAVVCEKVKNLDCEASSTRATRGTRSSEGASVSSGRGGSSTSSTENFYDNIHNEQSTASESSKTHSSTDSGSFSCELNSTCVGEALCPCS